MERTGDTSLDPRGLHERALQGARGATRPDRLGQGKGQEFSDLKNSISQYVKHTILIGEDADQIKCLLDDRDSHKAVETMQQAVIEASDMASSGDLVLLSPACASFDMFDGFEHRGQCFQEAVSSLIKLDQGGEK